MVSAEQGGLRVSVQAAAVPACLRRTSGHPLRDRDKVFEEFSARVFVDRKVFCIERHHAGLRETLMRRIRVRQSQRGSQCSCGSSFTAWGREFIPRSKARAEFDTAGGHVRQPFVFS
jgi:Fe-S cluster assembly iron-binding protein IscA